jgi:hypothetical protein
VVVAIEAAMRGLIDGTLEEPFDHATAQSGDEPLAFVNVELH